MSSHIIVILCDQVNEKCPIVPFGIQNEQWDLADPIPGRIEEFRAVRDEIRRKVVRLLIDKQVMTE